MPSLTAWVLALAVGACQQTADLQRRAPVLNTRFEPTAARFWFSAPKVEPDLDEALALAVRTVLQALPEDEQQHILESWLPSSPAPVLAATRPELDLLTLVRALHAQHGTRVLTLSAFFLGPAPMERART